MTSACRAWLVFTVLVCGTASLYGAAGEPAPTVPYEQRTDAFRRLLFELHFQPLHHLTELHSRPSESLIIVLGDPTCLDQFYLFHELPSLVKQGAAVLIATDMRTEGKAGEQLRQLAGVTVTGEKLVHRNPTAADIYDGSLHCPFIQPVAAATAFRGSTNLVSMLAAAVGAGNRPALFRNPHPAQPDLHVAANSPSRLEVSGRLPSGIYRLAQLPADCQDQAVLLRDGEDEIIEPRARSKPPLFAVGGTIGKGRVLVLADHSIFINRMILPRDNGNLEFAANCLHWLRGGSQRFIDSRETINRNRVLLWDDGRIRSDFKVPLKKTPVRLPPVMPPEPVIVAAFDETLANLEARDSFNRALLQHIDDLPDGWPNVVRNTVYLLTLAASLFLVYRFLWRSRHRPEYASPSLAKALRDHEPKASLLDQRRRALLRLGNVWDMGHRLAQECFEFAGVPLMGASAPRVRMMQGSRWQRWCEQRRVARLWSLARGDAARHISPVAFQRLQREVEQLKTALADGTITLG